MLRFPYWLMPLKNSRINYMFHINITLTLKFEGLYYHDVGNSCSITDVVDSILHRIQLMLKDNDVR